MESKDFGNLEATILEDSTGMSITPSSVFALTKSPYALKPILSNARVIQQARLTATTQLKFNRVATITIRPQQYQKLSNGASRTLCEQKFK